MEYTRYSTDMPATTVGQGTLTLTAGRANPYDESPYDSHAFPQSHPDHLATLSTLLGCQPAPVQSCRVLELGCAGGGNLIPMAYTLPGSQFVGVDLSGRQIADGKALVTALKLTNIELKHLDIMDVGERLGMFDYIIAHGVYSYLSREAQEKIHQICQDLLTPNGVAYISYNTFPGWHFRQSVRDMMLYHSATATDPSDQATQCRELLAFMAQAVSPQDPYKAQLEAENEFLRRSGDYYLLHDHLEEVNVPVYFHQFAEQASRHGLQYLGEAEFSAMLTSDLPKEIRETVQRFSRELIRTEQYIDFVRNRTFRQTLLCRSGIALNRTLSYHKITAFHVASSASPVADDPSGFAFSNGGMLTVHHPLVRAAYQILGQAWPQSVGFEELFESARARLSAEQLQGASRESQRQLLGVDLLTNYTRDFVTLRTGRSPFVTTVSERPRASDVARLQADKQDYVTNQIHEPIQMNPLTRQILALLDGTRTRAEVVAELRTRGGDGHLSILIEGSVDDNLLRLVDECLSRLAQVALLVA